MNLELWCRLRSGSWWWEEGRTMTKRHFTWIRLAWWGLIGLMTGSSAWSELFGAHPRWWVVAVWLISAACAFWLADSAWTELEAGARRD